MPDRQKRTKIARNAEYAARFPRRSRKKRRALRREKAHRQERDWLAVMGLLDKKDPPVTTPETIPDTKIRQLGGEAAAVERAA